MRLCYVSCFLMAELSVPSAVADDLTAVDVRDGEN